MNKNKLRNRTERSSKPRRRLRLELETLEDRLAPALFVVNSIGDADDATPGDGAAATLTGETTLRAAISEANAFDDGGPDRIEFDIPGAGPHTISPTSGPLPSITDGVTIDGYDDNGDGASANTNPTTAASNANLTIILNGGAQPFGNGFTIDSADHSATSPQTTIRGLVIQASPNIGILIFGQGTSGHVIEGNIIGMNREGTAAVGNSDSGVFISDSSDNLIGGLSAAARNLISGNSGDGISMDEGNTNTIQGNVIGLARNGIDVVANGGDGIDLEESDDNLIGGNTLPARNLISGNQGNGVALVADVAFDDTIIILGSDRNRIQNNLIGTDITGTLDRGNGSNGVLISSSDDNLIGGTTAAVRNIISGNSASGVLIDDEDQGGDGFGFSPSLANFIQGNYIGTQINGVTALGNDGAGVLVEDGINNLIGGPDAGEGNIIAFNGFLDTGVEILPGSTGNSILGNSIHSNAGLGIDLVVSNDGLIRGVTPNDATQDNDPLAGGNNLQNFPVLSGATFTAASTSISGSLHSTPDHDFRIEFFANIVPDPDSPGPGGLHGEGRTYLGFINVTTNGSGNATFTATTALHGIGILPSGQRFITSTATDQTDLGAPAIVGPAQINPNAVNDTSEFSLNILAQPPAPPRGVLVPSVVYHPFRLVPNRKGKYEGFITILPKKTLPGPTTIVLYNLPPGVVLQNPTDFIEDEEGLHPFITVPKGAKKNVPIRIKVVYTNTASVYDITFYNGFRVDVFSGQFPGGGEQ